MNKPISEDSYQILFFEIMNQILLQELAELSIKSELDLSVLAANYAIKYINSQSINDNQSKVDELKKLFAEKILPKFNDE